MLALFDSLSSKSWLQDPSSSSLFTPFHILFPHFESSFGPQSSQPGGSGLSGNAEKVPGSLRRWYRVPMTVSDIQGKARDLVLEMHRRHRERFRDERAKCHSPETLLGSSQ
eukprot:1103529-Amorphochlora_amoeboformis.AAC.1